MDVEEEYLDVLQNIEFAIVGVHRRQPALVDFDVDAALNALIAPLPGESPGSCAAAAQAERARPTSLRYDAVYVRMADGQRDAPFGRHAASAARDRSRSPSMWIIACLKRIRKSVARWNKEGGRQGYLTFIGRFVSKP